MRILFYILGMMLMAGLGSPSVSADDKVRNVHGSFTYQVDESLSIAEAKEKAFKLLQTQLIEKEFNSVVNSYASFRETESGEKYFSSGEVEAKGEWVSTIGKPKFELSVVDGVLFVTVTANGRVREISRAAIDLSVKVLRNGEEDRYEGYDFHDGDYMFLSFQSAVKGYLVVYLHDGGENIDCMLPYKRQQTGHMEVNSGERYVFFSRNDKHRLPYTDKIKLFAPAGPETDVLYVIFSPNPVYKAIDSKQEGEKSLLALPFEKFQQWLQTAKMSDPQLQVVTKVIHIEK